MGNQWRADRFGPAAGDSVAQTHLPGNVSFLSYLLPFQHNSGKMNGLMDNIYMRLLRSLYD
jgi:hypothetical protein